MKTFLRENTRSTPVDLRPQVFVRLEDGSTSVQPLPASEYQQHVEDYSIGSLLSAGVSVEDSSISSSLSPLAGSDIVDSIDVDNLDIEKYDDENSNS